MTVLSAANTYTPVKVVEAGRGFDLAIDGAFVGTITTELSRDGVGGWLPAGSFTSPGVYVGMASRRWFVRAGFRPGEYTSGSPTVEVL